MTRTPYLLHLVASPRPVLSNSYRIGRQLAERLSTAGTPLTVTERHLSLQPPTLIDATFAAETILPVAERHHAAESDALIDELAGAAVLVISTPMHNFTAPAALKAWIDQIVRPDRTFASTPQGKQALLAARPVYLVTSCGGPVGAGAGRQQDFLTPYLHYVLATIGLTDVHTLQMDRMNMGPENLQASLQRGEAWVADEAALLAAAAHRATAATP